jgi:hypothetical protein
MTPEQDDAVLNAGDTKAKGAAALAEEAVKRATYIIPQLNTLKKPRLDRIQLYRDLYAGKVKKKFRQQFNVLLPVFSGVMDTLMADFNDDLALEYAEQEPADYLTVRKSNALWNMEVNSTAPNASFAYKTRTDRSNALFSGRGFMMNYAQSDPEYCNHFEVYELEDAIFQPQGGGIMETHLYKGRQNIVRSKSDLESGPYDQAQVKKLLALAAKTDFFPTEDDLTNAALGKYQAMSLSPTSADYVGEQLFRLVEMAITLDGVEYHLVFSPWYKEWVRFDKLSVIFSAGIYPATSWATHEDNKNFLSKSYADDIYGVADAIHTLFNQELTNREKQNNNARAYDKDMFPDVAKLDQAQYRADALVPFDTKGGQRKISEGIYSFQTPNLGGTINIIDWIRQETGRDIGVTDISQGAADGVTKKATVALAEQNSISKRLLLRQSSYTEAMARIGKLFLQGAKDHLPAEKALKRLGIEGQGWDAVIRRTDLDFYGDIDVLIKSSAIEMKNSQLKKDARLKTLDSIALDPNQAAQINPRWIVEEKLRSAGEYDDAEIKIAMDTKNYGNKEEVAYAHEGIQEILAGKKPDLFYGATTIFMQIIHDYSVNNRTSLGMPKFNALMEYEMAHAPIVQENMARKAEADAATFAAGAPAEATPSTTAQPAIPAVPALPTPA